MSPSGAALAARTGTRRDRLRAQTLDEIKVTARRLLVAEGPAAVTLRAIAREMGVTAPALYRYVDSHDALIGTLVGDLYGELADALEVARDAEPPGQTGARLMAASRAFRTWSVAHPAEFALLFGTPVPGVALPDAESSSAATEGRRFGQVFASLFAELWATRPFPVPDDADLPASLVDQLVAYRDRLGVDLPVGVLAVFVSCWVRLYGTVTMEVFGHLSFCLDDAGSLFDLQLGDIAQLLGLDPA